MNDQRSLLERRAQRGTRRGPDALIETLRHSPKHRAELEPATLGGPDGVGAARRILVAAAIFALVGIAGAMALRNSADRDLATTSWTAPTPAVDALCGAGEPPSGALNMDLPLLACQVPGAGPRTADHHTNSWVDGLATSPSAASEVTDFGDDYRFSVIGDLENVSGVRTEDGWVIDAVQKSPGDAGGVGRGGAALSPNQPFRFVDGELRIEAGMVLGHDDYDESSWYEIVVSTAPTPTGNRRDGLYINDAFPGAWTLGCRFEAGGNIICTLVDDTSGDAPDYGRVWQASGFEEAGDTTFGGFAQPDQGRTYSGCAKLADLADCLDEVSVVFGTTSLDITINGVRYFEQTGLPALPDDIAEGEVFAHVGVMTSGEEPLVRRFHGASLAVNPPGS